MIDIFVGKKQIYQEHRDKCYQKDLVLDAHVLHGLMLVSLVTRRDKKEVLDRYYAKMRTEVNPDPEVDKQNLAAAYADPEKCLNSVRMFPGTDWEFAKPRREDIIGFLISVAVCGLVIGLLVWLAGIGG